MSRNGPFAILFHTLFVVFMLAPLVVVCLVAFTPEGYLSLPGRVWSLRWFRAILDYPEFLRAFRDSLWLAALSSTVAIGLAVPAALAIARYRFPGREAMTALFMSPLMVPHVVLGIAFLRFFTQIGLSGTFLGLVLSHIIVIIPFALRLVLAASYGIDRRIEHAAISLGASPAVVFRRVTLPLILPGVVSGWLLAAINSFDEVTMTVFIASPATTTLPVRMFLYIQDNIDPLIAAVSACLIALTAMLLMALDRLFGLDRLFVRNRKRLTPVSTTIREPDVAVIGGGVVGGAIALGLARNGAKVAILDEGDTAFRASRGNFALVWVQSKGFGMPDYALWSRRSADSWHELAASLAGETGIDVAHSQPGGFMLCLSQDELDKRVDAMRRLHNSRPLTDFPYEVLDHAETKRRLPAIGKDVVGSLYSPLDGHVNSLKLFRALREATVRRGVDYRPNSPVESIVPKDGGFAITGPWGEMRVGKVVLCAGLGNARLASMVGLDAPVKPSKGQIIVTEKTEPFLHNPMVTVRQTDEGGVMIGDSQEDRGFDTVVGQPILSTMAERAVKMFPRLAGLNVVRTWSALRVMSPDGFPIYDQSETHPGAFVVTCHSGVTLAANHALTLAPAILAGTLPESVASFTARRFHVPAHS